VPGGKTGQLSIYNGLNAAQEVSGGDKSIVLIHDGVRPLINTGLLSDCINSVKNYGNAITAGIVTETIAVVDEEGYVTNLPERKDSRVAKAPQCFWLDDILTAHNNALAEGRDDYIDSCSIMKHYGHRLHMIVGPAENIKITTPEDFYIMRAFIEAKENAQMYMPEEQ
nr:2-C-methyl-D-erythritol 4-phosphate cytidylyltransferase [Lachnospiraceae bacterium]